MEGQSAPTGPGGEAVHGRSAHALLCAPCVQVLGTEIGVADMKTLGKFGKSMGKSMGKLHI